MKVFDSFKTTKWSKGDTTELFIYPEDANLNPATFDIRISIATINGNSVFTPFEDYHRILTLLEGELELHHKNQHTTNLLPFDQDYFKGKWETRSFGIAKNFNIIFKEKVAPLVGVHHLIKSREEQIELTGTLNLVYIDEGEVLINKTSVKAGSIALLDEKELHLQPSSDSIIIVCQFDNIS